MRAMEFLSEKPAFAAVKSAIAKADRVRLAVAFWGQGVGEELGLGREGLEVEVVCNLDSGACNPDEIGWLMSHGDRVKVRSNPRLHGKVYWTPSAVMIGSSNASSNGLVIEGGPSTGWSEANVLTVDPAMIAAASLWIDEQGADPGAYEITPSQLALAKALWAERRGNAPSGLPLKQHLLAAYRAAPDHEVWRKVKVVVWSSDLSPAGQQEFLDAGYEFGESSAYERMHEDLSGGDLLIDIRLMGKRASFFGYYSVPSPKIESAALTIVQRRKCLAVPGFGHLTLGPEEEEQILKLAPGLLAKGDGCCCIGLAEVVAALDDAQ